jgi:hypothetical protein
VNAIAKQGLLVGIATAIAGDDQDFALLFGKAADDLDDAAVDGTGGAVPSTQ